MTAIYRIGFTFLCMAGLLAAAPAGAQTDEAAAEDELSIEEVIVTATRRETGIQMTAASVDAFSGSKLEELGKTNALDFLDAVPGVTAMAVGPTRNRVIFRNIATSTQESGSPTSATYFDDFTVTPIFSAGATAIRLVDMDRVEVLKGPQGTLFGRSAMGGIVRYISSKPSTEGTFGGVNTYLSSTTDGGTNFGGHGYLNLPITENLAVRAVAYTYQNDGFIDSLELGVPDYNDEDMVGGRIALHWDASDNFSLDLTYLNQSSNGADNSVTTTRDPGDLDVGGDEGPDIPFDINARTQIRGVLTEDELEQEFLNLKLEYDFDAFTATFLATRSNLEGEFIFDQREFIFVRHSCVCDLQLDEEESDLMELRLVSSGDGFFDWIAGAYYEDSERNSSQETNFQGPDALLYGFIPLVEGQPPFPGWPSAAQDTATVISSHEEALYAEVGLNFNEDTRLVLGYRRSDVEYGTLLTHANGFFDIFTGQVAHVDVPYDTQEDVSTYKVSLEHSFNEDIFGYALATSGYRRGGVNLPDIISPFSTFDSDTLWNYELGLKTTWLDGRLVANVSAYLLDYDDIQLAVQDQVTFARSTQNVGKAKVTGLELGVQYLVNENWRLGFAGSLSNPELKEDIRPTIIDPAGDPNDPANLIFTGRKGDRLPGSSTENFSISANYDRPLSNGMGLFASAFYRYVGSRLNDFNLDLDVKLPSYSLTDLRLGVSHPNGWSVALFADNVFDEAIIYKIDRQGPMFEAVSTNRPRTVGLNFIYNYR